MYKPHISACEWSKLWSHGIICICINKDASVFILQPPHQKLHSSNLSPPLSKMKSLFCCKMHWVNFSSPMNIFWYMRKSGSSQDMPVILTWTSSWEANTTWKYFENIYLCVNGMHQLAVSRFIYAQNTRWFFVHIYIYMYISYIIYTGDTNQ